MIDPTANTLGYRALKTFPDTRLGLRMMYAALRLTRFVRPPSALHVEKLRIPRRDGGKVRLVVVRPKKTAMNMPVVLHIHGGGYAAGVPEQDYEIVRRYISAAPGIFVMPDYRVSLKAPFPAALYDCYDALIWLRDNARNLGGRLDQIFIMGESAGGGLTASLCQMARDKGEVGIACQFPLYAMLDDRPDQWTEIENSLLAWSKTKNRLGWKLYLGQAIADPPNYSVPARAKALHGLPPAVGFIGDHDGFLGQNLAYFDLLRSFGVDARLQVFKGAYHGVDILAPNSDVGKAIWDYAIEEFKRAVETCSVQN
ncbi:MAG: alpha/beta hydrolase [Rhodobacteraceae bacterium]|nr:alpha/beta hydrolase [Paracoccaceae bacterium]